MWRSEWTSKAFPVYEYTAAPPEEQNDRGPYSSFTSAHRLQRWPIGDCSKLLMCGLPSQIKEASRMPAAGNKERHRTGRIGWLRAAVLGANDGILSTSSLLLGVAAAHATHSNVLVAGVAGLVAGAMSMAAGEYVSVRSQADTEQADLALERAELKADYKGEHKALMAIYGARGLEPALAKQVAEQLMAHDALGPTPAMNSASPRLSVR